jgi:hypothetical protein
MFGADLKPVTDSLDHAVNSTVPLTEQGFFWMLFCGGVVTLLLIAVLILQIRHYLRRNPPVSSEIDEKIKTCKLESDRRFEGMNKKIDRLNVDLKARSLKGDEGRRRIHEELKRLTRETAGQESSISLMNQRQVQMDTKIDRILERI